MPSGEKKDAGAKKEGFFRKIFGTPGMSSATDKPKKHTSKTSKHCGGDDDQKDHPHDESPDAGHEGKGPNTDQVLLDGSDASK
ncbi:hypothetical protein TSMEX_010222 [Taenia solium]|eukprot:TsM_000904500 transcript=TsM_000904500 gene=TsM_000904500